MICMIHIQVIFFFSNSHEFDLFFFVADVDVSQKCAQMFMKMAKRDTLIATLCNDGTVHLLHLSYVTVIVLLSTLETCIIILMK